MNQFINLKDKHLLHLCYRGSVSFGLKESEKSKNPYGNDDLDLAGIFVNPRNHYLGIDRSEESLEINENGVEAVYHEFQNFVKLLTANNPNCLCVLWTDPKHDIYTTQEFSLLRQNKNLFSSRQVYEKFVSYANAQIRKMTSVTKEHIEELNAIEAVLIKYVPNINNYVLNQEQRNETVTFRHKLFDNKHLDKFVEVEIRNLDQLDKAYKVMRKRFYAGNDLGEKRRTLIKEVGYNCKHASHIIRLLMMAKEFLVTGYLNVDRTKDRDMLLEIKAGLWSLEQVNNLSNLLFIEAEQAAELSTLPEFPDRKAIDNLCSEIIYGTFTNKST